MDQIHNSTTTATLNHRPRLRIAFIHPDLGIGGAERLVVDAAVGLQKLGHQVQIFTSSHDPSRCFAETVDGTIPVTVLGDRIFPRAFRNRFITILAILRQIHLSISLIASVLSPFGGRKRFDIYFVDQLSASIPLLRYGSRTRVVFYCHFPDLLLSPPQTSQQSVKLISKLKSIYRLPLDWVEEFTTGQADKILVNSKFTAGVFKETFKRISVTPKCIYPGVDVDFYNRSNDSQPNLDQPFPFQSNRPTILSINRFEKKKDAILLLKAFILFRSKVKSNLKADEKPRLVLAGGYDERLLDNRETFEELNELISGDDSLSHHSIKTEDTLQGSPSSPDVLFWLNISQAHKHALLNAPSTRMLAYTASNEHLGIGPLEGMACRLPVLATNSGGPKETVSDGVTGFLVPPRTEDWAKALEKILGMNENDQRKMGDAGRRRVEELFSTGVMAQQFEKAIREVLQAKGQPDVWLEKKFLALVVVPLISILISLFLMWKILP
ncbi:mannosyltransferase complex subunit Alg2 [Phakopsora pachyrhizi]|uniref:Alpha-1,3/1,6-mannosyltransferase ALG2 n=1 Tax=Phakopsora pachyrhizi TaxID=170000 RepID=A0AAV0BKA2_PHAPC|nr:mannosyltransferase complex subunit Alg2 [Phakopsora pachyrhizi]